MRELLTGLIFSVVAFGAFMIFYLTGWHGAPDVCVTEQSLWHASNSCYCEYFNAAVLGHAKYAQQVMNTWSNLAGLLYGAIVGVAVWRYRVTDQICTDNRMRSTTAYPLVYICVVIFLGLGSMWFHASIVRWAGFFDLLSMFMFVCFIVAYSFVRLVQFNAWWDWLVALCYGVAVIVLAFTVWGTEANSALVILPCIIGAAGMEIWAEVRDPRTRPDTAGYVWLGVGAGSFALAFVSWILGQTGGPLCFQHGFQFHAVWHWLAGATSVSLYFFWVRSPR